MKRDLKLEPEPTKEESDVQYEEIEIDESQPNDEAYSTEVGAIGFAWVWFCGFTLPLAY